MQVVARCPMTAAFLRVGVAGQITADTAEIRVPALCSLGLYLVF